MDWLRAGKRKMGGGGISEANVPYFVEGGGVGALAGGMVAMHLSHDMPMVRGMAVTAVGIGLGHMVGHEFARREIDKRK